MNDPLEYLRQTQDTFVDNLKEFIRIPSQSGSPDLRPEIRRAAEWLTDKLSAAGAKNVEILETAGHPVVYGDWFHSDSAPTVLIYGHYDVQPPEPLNLWKSPPFDPEIREGKLYGRGAADDKAGVMAAVAVVEAFTKSGNVPSVNLKFCFEGEEEVGSPNLGALIEKESKRFAANVVVSVDGGQWNPEQPQIVLGLRGTLAAELNIKGPDHDLHSGLMGGAILNPVEALARLMASMKNADGRITVDGFYDDVVELSPEERKPINAIPDTTEMLLRESGAPALYGEKGYTPIEQTWIRPTLEFNGVWGGHSGPGPKTIIPSEAGAKITCRLVANQDPQKVLDLLDAHIRKHAPAGVDITFKAEAARAFPYSISRDHPANRLLAEILEQIYNRKPYEVRIGGSVPVCDVFSQILNAEAISIGCSTADCNLHAPNEFVTLSTLHKGAEALVLLLQRLGARLGLRA